MKLLPRKDRVIVEQLEGKDQTSTGIWIPDSFKNNADIQQAIIVKKGPEVSEDLKEGMYVTYMKGAGTPFNFEKDSKKELRLIRDADLIAIIEQDEQ